VADLIGGGGRGNCCAWGGHSAYRLSVRVLIVTVWACLTIRNVAKHPWGGGGSDLSVLGRGCDVLALLIDVPKT